MVIETMGNDKLFYVKPLDILYPSYIVLAQNDSEAREIATKEHNRIMSHRAREKVIPNTSFLIYLHKNKTSCREIDIIKYSQHSISFRLDDPNKVCYINLNQLQAEKIIQLI